MYVMAQEGTREYQATPKGRGFVYVTRISCTSESRLKAARNILNVASSDATARQR